MIVVGLTGSIGMGKTTVVGLLKERGIPIHDADVAVHRLLEKDAEVQERVGTAFPFCLRNGKIDRSCLGEAVFADPKSMRALEEIVHPRLFLDQRLFILENENAGQKMVVLDIPLLYETKGIKAGQVGYASWFDCVIVVYCALEIQKKRVLERPTMTPERFQQIRDLQMPDEDKMALADFVLRTDDEGGAVEEKLDGILRAIERENT